MAYDPSKAPPARKPAPSGGGSPLDMLSSGFMSGLPGVSAKGGDAYSAARGDSYAAMNNPFVTGGNAAAGNAWTAALLGLAPMLAVGALVWLLVR